MIFNFLINKAVYIRRINPPKMGRLGDLLFDGLNFIARFMWTKRSFVITEVQRISAYSTVDWGLENEFANVDIEFADSSKLLFDGSIEEHRKIIDIVLSKLGGSQIDWTSPLPALDAKLENSWVYQKNCH